MKINVSYKGIEHMTDQGVKMELSKEKYKKKEERVEEHIGALNNLNR